jgi:MFS family permease
MQDVKVNEPVSQSVGNSKWIKIFDKLAFIVLLLSSFLLPIFVIPLPYSNFSFNKQILFVSAVVFACIVYLLSSLKRGEITFDKSKFLLFSLVVVLVSVLSSVASGSFMLSFFGQGFEVGTTASLLIGILALWIVPVYFNTKDRIFYAYLAIVSSFAIVAIYQILRIFLGADFLSLGIFGDTTSNLIGKWYDLGIVFGLVALFAVIAGEFLTLSKVLKFVTYSVFLASLVLMAIVNFSLSWVVLGMFSLVIGVYIFSFSKSKVSNEDDFEDEDDVNLPNKRKLPIFSIISVIICSVFVLFGTYFGNLIYKPL